MSEQLDWTSFLQDWNDRARRAVAAMLIKHGLAGPPALGVKEYFDTEIAKVGDSTLLAAVSPIAGSIDTAGELDAVLRQAHEQLRLLEQRLDLRYLESYEWEVIRNDGLFHAPGDSRLLADAEQRLGVTLPPSYRAFVLASNGWIASTSKLIPLQRVQAFGQADPQYVREWSLEPPGGISDERYFVYGDAQQPYNIRSAYLPDCLLISEPLLEVNERLLLNPRVRFDNQELEAWFMTPRIAGAVRYRSFTELMQFMKLSDEALWRRLTQ